MSKAGNLSPTNLILGLGWALILLTEKTIPDLARPQSTLDRAGPIFF